MTFLLQCSNISKSATTSQCIQAAKNVIATITQAMIMQSRALE